MLNVIQRQQHMVVFFIDINSWLNIYIVKNNIYCCGIDTVYQYKSSDDKRHKQLCKERKSKIKEFFDSFED